LPMTQRTMPPNQLITPILRKLRTQKHRVPLRQ
jgi:hypothetical protein